MGLLAFIFTMIGEFLRSDYSLHVYFLGLVVIFSVPIGTMAVGWTYAFGECSAKRFWEKFYEEWTKCALN